MATGMPSISEVVTDASEYDLGDTVAYTGYWSHDSAVKLLVSDYPSFKDCDYDTTTGCLAASDPDSSSPTTATTFARSNAPWYAQVCDDDDKCTIYIEFSDHTIVHAGGDGYSSTIAGVDFMGESIHDYSGFSVATGDVNGDGYDDFLIGAPSRAADTGETYLLLGRSDDDEWPTGLANSDASFVGESNGDKSGHSVSSAGDFDNDGYSDILISAYLRMSNTGFTYLILGSEEDWAMDTSLADADQRYIGEVQGDESGYSVSSAGDFNNDGADDILIGSRESDENDGDAGQTYLVLGNAAGSGGPIDTVSPTITLDSPEDGSALEIGSLIELTVTDTNLENVLWTDGTIPFSTDFTGTYDIDTTGWEEGEVTITVYANDTEGNSNTAEFTFSMANKITENTVDATADEPVTIDKTEDTYTGAEFETSSDITDGTVSMAEYTENPVTEGASGVLALDKYVDIEVSEDIRDALTYFTIKIYYTDQEVLDAGIDESTLKLHSWDETLEEWTVIDPSGVDMENNFVWGTVDHLSLFGGFGSEVIEQNRDDGGSPSGGGFFSSIITKIVDTEDETEEEKEKEDKPAKKTTKTTEPKEEPEVEPEEDSGDAEVIDMTLGQTEAGPTALTGFVTFVQGTYSYIGLLLFPLVFLLFRVKKKSNTRYAFLSKAYNFLRRALIKAVPFRTR